jgi:hypothetical protein
MQPIWFTTMLNELPPDVKVIRRRQGGGRNGGLGASAATPNCAELGRPGPGIIPRTGGGGGEGRKTFESTRRLDAIDAILAPDAGHSTVTP